MEYNRTILVVDDEPETLKGYTDFLSHKETVVARKSSRHLYGTGQAHAISGAASSEFSEDYKILLAQSGEEAIRLFENELKAGRRVAAGFFDVKLGGGMDGLATIHAIKSMDKDIHCVVVTAYHDRTVDEINELFGAEFKDQWDYLNKPFTQGEIVQKARQMVSAWNRKRKLEVLNQQLVRSERLAAVGQVARGIGHEFGNILLRILGKADLAMMEKDPVKVLEHLKVVVKAAERAGVIVRNLQSFSKTEPSFSHEAISVPLEEALSLLTHEFVKASVQVEKNYKQTPPIRIDTGGMAQVFLNLLINAIHAMPQGGKIQIAIDQASDESGALFVVIQVKDSGQGIPADVLPKIFEFAFSTKGDAGSGLGLSLSKEIIEAHGGKILVQTEVGKGTEFSVWLPLAKNK